jgi:hypothetical protein
VDRIKPWGSTLLLRLRALVIALLLISSLSVMGIAGVAVAGSFLTHGNTGAHANGTTVAIGPGRNARAEDGHQAPVPFSVWQFLFGIPRPSAASSARARLNRCVLY